jgi:hypothetical protein
MALVYEKKIYGLLLICMLAVALLGLTADGFSSSLRGFLHLQTHSSRLISDFTVLAGSGGALLNAAVMGCLALLIIKLSGVSMSGPTLAAVFTIAGFSLFGKTPLNTAPVVLGVFLAAKTARRPFKSYILMALYGTALGPLVSYFVSEAGLPLWGGLLAGLIAGCAAGFILPGVSMAMLRMHEGFNLYNIGLSCGFMALFAASGLAAVNRQISTELIWNDSPGWELLALTPILALIFIVGGIRLDGPRTLANLRRMMRLSGRLPTDFMSDVAPGAALLNAGLLGLAGMLYLVVIGADINGPVIGGLLTVMGFATFGKHPRNCWPVSLGVILATLVFGKSLTAPGPVLAMLFATTLAPLAGEFGALVGVAAGVVHLTIVECSAAWHGGLDLYNNGFAGGFTATLFVAVIQWFKSIEKRD